MILEIFVKHLKIMKENQLMYYSKWTLMNFLILILIDLKYYLNSRIMISLLRELLVEYLQMN